MSPSPRLTRNSWRPALPVAAGRRERPWALRGDSSLTSGPAAPALGRFAALERMKSRPRAPWRGHCAAVTARACGGHCARALGRGAGHSAGQGAGAGAPGRGAGQSARAGAGVVADRVRATSAAGQRRCRAGHTAISGHRDAAWSRPPFYLGNTASAPLGSSSWRVVSTRISHQSGGSTSAHLVASGRPSAARCLLTRSRPRGTAAWECPAGDAAGVPDIAGHSPSRVGGDVTGVTGE
jgi:hypothetical protein